MIRHVSSTPSCRVKRALSPTTRRGAGPRRAWRPRRPRRRTPCRADRLGSGESARCASTTSRIPVVGSSLTTSWFGSGWRDRMREPEPGRVLEDEAELGLRDRQPLAGADEERNARPAPVVDLEAQGGVRLGGRVRRHAVDRQVAVVLAADVVRRVGFLDRAEERDLRVLERRGSPPAGGSIAQPRRPA